MTYIGADGTVIEKRSLFRISLLSDIFFGIMDAVLLFGYSIWYPYRKVPRARQRPSRDGGGQYFIKEMLVFTSSWMQRNRNTRCHQKRSSRHFMCRDVMRVVDLISSTYIAH